MTRKQLSALEANISPIILWCNYFTGGLVCLSLSLSPRVTKAPKTTATDPEMKYLDRDLSLITGLADVGCYARIRD